MTIPDLEEGNIHGIEDVQPDAVEVLIYRLRKRLAETGVAIVTLRGLGYSLEAQA